MKNSIFSFDKIKCLKPTSKRIENSVCMTTENNNIDRYNQNIAVKAFCLVIFKSSSIAHEFPYFYMKCDLFDSDFIIFFVYRYDR